MSSKGFRERILEVIEDGPVLSNTITQTSLLPSSGKEAAFGIGAMGRGKIIAFDFSGRISTLVTTPGTLSFAIRIGTIDVFIGGAMALNAVAQTNVHWHLVGELVCRAAGTNVATVLFPKGCEFHSHAVINAPAPGSGSAGIAMLPFNVAPALGNGFDFNADQKVDLLATWSVANSANSVTLHAGNVDVYTGG